MFLLRLVGLLFLLLGFALDFCKGVTVVGCKVLVVEVTFLAVFAYFVEVVHVELSGMGGYLSDEGGVVGVLEVLGKDHLSEELLVGDNKADP